MPSLLTYMKNQWQADDKGKLKRQGGDTAALPERDRDMTAENRTAAGAKIKAKTLRLDTNIQWGKEVFS